MFKSAILRLDHQVSTIREILARNHVVFLDRGLIVVNKPPGLVAQGGTHLTEVRVCGISPNVMEN
jgi:23S rRNA-/tRNA-specific pseudouridylate synthase